MVVLELEDPEDFLMQRGKGKEPQFNTKQQVSARRIIGIKQRNGEI